MKFVVLVAVLAAAIGVVAWKRSDSTPGADSPRARVDSAVPSSIESDAQALPRLVSLGAGKCVPCKAMEPIREELQSDYAGRLRVAYHDVWQNPRAGERYGIRLIPTLIYFDAQGRELGRTEGYRTKRQILDAFAQWGVSLREPTASPAETGS